MKAEAEIEDMLARITARNLERMRLACEVDGDRELAGIIAVRLASMSQAPRSNAGPR